MRVEFTRVNSDMYDNPRYVCHYTQLLLEGERGYEQALKNARQFGGSKYRGKDYGGGIVFQSYNIEEVSRRISKFTDTHFDFGVMLFGEEVFSSNDELVCNAYKNTINPESIRNQAYVKKF